MAAYAVGPDLGGHPELIGGLMFALEEAALDSARSIDELIAGIRVWDRRIQDTAGLRLQLRNLLPQFVEEGVVVEESEGRFRLAPKFRGEATSEESEEEAAGEGEEEGEGEEGEGPE